MPQFRKIPVIINAVKYLGLYDSAKNYDQWFQDAIKDGSVVLHENGDFDVKTLEGTMAGRRGDYIIRGVKGELYPCKPEIFELTYEAA